MQTVIEYSARAVTAASHSVSSPSPGRPPQAATDVRIAASAYGVSFGVCANDQKLFAQLRRRFPPGTRTMRRRRIDGPIRFNYSVQRENASPHACYTAATNGTSFIRAHDEAAVLDAFESAVRFDIAVTTADFVFVHAGVVGWRGGAIVIPAPSMSGKSRLVAALVDRGATYYSDEFAVIDCDGLVHPFRIPISIRSGDGGRQRVIPPPARQVSPLPIRTVVSTIYEPGTEWHPRRGTAADALLALLSNTVRARIAPGDVLGVLATAVASATLIEGRRAEAHDIVASLLEEPA